jgi:putative tryptophan/tyrosine transport system substrate-binding protein
MRAPRQRVGAAPISTGILIVVLVMLVALPLVADAQPTGKAPRVAYLSATSVAISTVEDFRQGLRELGYVEGRNILIEYRWADGRFDRLPALAAELVRLGVNVIVAANTPAALAAKNATSTIPIILVTSGDPVGSGLVASLARPGGNVTGLSLMPTLAISGKQLELLKEAFPTVTHVAVLANPANPPTAGLLMEIELAARSLGLRIRVVQVREPKEFGDAFATMKSERAPALLVIADPLVGDNRDRIVAFAAANRLPAIYPYRTFVDAGGLMSYGANVADLNRRAATYVDRILKGAKPAELPIEQPTKFELVVNLKTAKALGLTIPPSLLLRADHVIQ